MQTRGLTQQALVKAAVEYIENTGEPVISMHELARRLGIKTPSLYNHVKNTTELQYKVFEYAIDKFVSYQKEAICNKRKDDAVRAFAKAYHSFATENKGLYRLIMSIPKDNDSRAKELALPLLKIVVEILSEYGLDDETAAHWQRVFRAILHGFISQEDLGYFYYYNSINLEKSRDIAVQCFLDGLHAEIKNYQHNT